MSRRLPLALFAGVLASLVDAPASAETCICSNATFSMASLLDPAPWTNCTSPDPSDRFWVAANCHVTVESDLTFAPGGQWLVRSGGSLHVRVMERPLVWTMPGGSIADGGELLCESGSTCQFLGGYRSYGQFPPTIESATPITVTGTSCSRCHVEIFLDHDDEGRKFITWTTALTSGVFLVNLEPGIIDLPHITATSTDTQGNTSPFATPVAVGPVQPTNKFVFLPLMLR